MLAAATAAVLSISGLLGAAARERPPRLASLFPSPEAAARAVLEGVAGEDSRRLARIAVSEREFATVLWPELPASRRERNLPLAYVWTDFAQKSRAHLAQTLTRHGGQRYELVRVEFEREPAPYPSFTIHRKTALTVRSTAGDERRVRLFGSMIEQAGKYKILSYIVD